MITKVVCDPLPRLVTFDGDPQQDPEYLRFQELESYWKSGGNDLTKLWELCLLYRRSGFPKQSIEIWQQIRESFGDHNPDNYEFILVGLNLDRGDMKSARTILEGMSEEDKHLSKYKKLWHTLLVFEEADELGDVAVYPFTVEFDKRWKDTLVLPKELDGYPLNEFFPGKVLKLNEKGIYIFIGVFNIQFNQKEQDWLDLRYNEDVNQVISSRPLEIGDFIEIGFYQNDKIVLALHETAKRTPEEWDKLLGYKSEWRLNARC